MNKLKNYFDLSVLELCYVDQALEGWRMRAPVPDGRIAFNFDKQHPEDKAEGVVQVSATQYGHEVEYRLTSLEPQGFVLRNGSSVAVIDTEPFNRLIARDVESDRIDFEAYDSSNLCVVDRLAAEQKRVIVGLFLGAVSISRINRLRKIDNELRTILGRE